PIAAASLALPDLALQREGAPGARLQRNPAPPPRARRELHAARLARDATSEAPHLVSRRRANSRLDANSRSARTFQARSAHLSARRRRACARGRAGELPR